MKFETKVKYQKTLEDGKTKKVTEPYLFDAVSFTEGEALATKEFEKMISGDFIISNMSPSNIAQVFRNPDGDRFFKTKVTFVDVDSDSGKEKKTVEYMLVEANNVKHAYEFLDECLSDMIAPYETPAISESPIMDVFEYNLQSVVEGITENTTNALNEVNAGIRESVKKFSQVNDQMKIGVDITPRDEWGNEK